MATFSFRLSKNLYIRDPEQTELGRKIVRHGIRMIDKKGFEDFTFKKLAADIGSTEASVYRYFDNKHKLLIYLIDWYWTWLEYQIDFHLNNVKDPHARLRVCLLKLSEQKELDPQAGHVDQSALQRIVTAEFEKTYLTKKVDADNRVGLFLPYKSLCKKVAAVVLEVNPNYKFPHSLVSTVLLAISHQLFYAEHLPSLSDIKYDPGTHHKQFTKFIEGFVFNTIGVKP